MENTRSADGTRLAYDRFGAGRPLIMVVGAFNTRETTEPLGHSLERYLTILNYDRRGRGDSTDTMPYAVEREIEDLDAMIRVAGGEAAVFGYSSGAVLALRAALAGLAITRLVLYEPPFSADDRGPGLPDDLANRLEALVSAGRRDDAVELFQTVAVGVPPEVVAQIRHAPFWPDLEAMAHTLAYEVRVIGDRSLPRAAIRSLATPTCVLAGGATAPAMLAAAQATALALPHGEMETLPGQEHHLNPDAVAPAITRFLAS